MTGVDIPTLIGSFGFPIVLIGGMLWFGKRDFWPWFIKYMADRARAQDARHKEYILSIDRSTDAMSALVELLTRIDERLEGHTHKLTIIEAAARAAASMKGH